MSLFKPKQKINPKLTVIRVLTFLTGIILYTVAFNVFFMPYDIVIGGLSGISIIINHFFGMNPALFVLITSLTLLVISFILLNKEQTMPYLLGSLLLPLFIQLTSPLTTMNFLAGADIFLIVIFGGLISGMGTGLIFKTGFLTGDSDLLSQIISKYFRLTPNRATFIIGAIIVASGGIITTVGLYDFAKVMYAIVAVYISSTVSEKVIIGISSNKTFYIFTDQINPIKEYIKTEFNISLTVMKATGGFSGHKESVIMCVIPTRDYFKIREGLKLIDPEAFFIATEAYETTQTRIKEVED